LSRFSIAEIKREALQRGLVASIGDTTLWRWLSEDALRPWRFRSWIFPRDPQFGEKAGRILDLYEGTWQGEPLTEDDCVVSADEKTSIQARRRIAPTLPPASGAPIRVVTGVNYFFRSTTTVSAGSVDLLTRWLGG
jgi:hypothetical protein